MSREVMASVLDALNGFEQNYGNMYQSAITPEQLDEVINALRAELAKPESLRSSWVSVSDVLPPVRVRVFMCRSGGSRDIAIYDPDRYTPAWRYANDQSESIRDVTHWMHYPLPPTI